MEYIFEFLLFSGKIFSLIIFLFLFIVLLKNTKNEPKAKLNRIEIMNVNREHDAIKKYMHLNITEKSRFKKKKFKEAKISLEKNVYICDFFGDIGATSVEALRDEITAILSVARSNDEVLVLLESAGGTVQGYGLAASQLQRIINAKIKLTVVVDKVAASGGYLMACVADNIIAAPFAIIGSIGVIAQIPNFNKVLKKNNIDYEQITAGKYKRTLTLFGENTEEGRNKFQADINRTHKLFQEFVLKKRPMLDIEKVATGEYWQAVSAKELNLVDELATSDEVISRLIENANVYKVKKKLKRSLYQNFFKKAESILEYFKVL